MIIAWLLMGGLTLSSIELPKKKQGKERKEGNSATYLVGVGVGPGRVTSCFFSDNNYWS